MRRSSAAGILAICLGLTAACGGGNKDADNANATAGSDQKTADARPAPITQTGCLTARGDQFVLTDLQRGTESGTEQAATQTYQLIGNEDELRQHVGQQVRVNGEAEPAQVAEVRESTPPAAQGGATGTAGQQPQAGGTQPQAGAQSQTGTQSQSGTQPQVTAETETRLEVTKLRVQSLTPTGSSCAAETKQP
jgi:hypothetical protein